MFTPLLAVYCGKKKKAVVTLARCGCTFVSSVPACGVAVGAGAGAGAGVGVVNPDASGAGERPPPTLFWASDPVGPNQTAMVAGNLEAFVGSNVNVTVQLATVDARGLVSSVTTSAAVTQLTRAGGRCVIAGWSESCAASTCAASPCAHTKDNHVTNSVSPFSVGPGVTALLVRGNSFDHPDHPGTADPGTADTTKDGTA